MRLIFPTLCALGVLALPATQATAAECGEVTLTEMDWASAQLVTAVSKFLLEQGYGCSVTTVPASGIPALASVAETGEPDIVTEVWTNTVPAYPSMVEEGQVVELADVLSDGGIEAYWVPAYLVEEHPELATLEGVLANPDLVGNRFHNCPNGWACHRINNRFAEAAGFEAAGIENFVHGSGETLATSIASAYTEGAPWFGYYWAPTSLLGAYPMVMVDVGGYEEETFLCNKAEDCATPGISAFPTSIVTTAVAQAFVDSHPEEVALMANVSFTNDQMGEVLAWQEENNASSEEGAVYFLSNYNDVWGGWLNDEAREKLSALLQ